MVALAKRTRAFFTFERSRFLMYCLLVLFETRQVFERRLATWVWTFMRAMAEMNFNDVTITILFE